MKSSTNLSSIRASAVKNLDSSVSKIQAWLDNHEEEPIGLLLERILRDYNDRDHGHMHLYTLFISTLNVSDPASFLDGLCSFVENDLLDDGAYRIRWIKPKTTSVPSGILPGFDIREIQWNQSIYGWEVVESTENDPDAVPEVVIDCHTGTQDPIGIILALDALVAQDKRREALQDQLESLRQSLSIQPQT